MDSTKTCPLTGPQVFHRHGFPICRELRNGIPSQVQIRRAYWYHRPPGLLPELKVVNCQRAVKPRGQPVSRRAPLTQSYLPIAVLRLRLQFLLGILQGELGGSLMCQANLCSAVASGCSRDRYYAVMGSVGDSDGVHHRRRYSGRADNKLRGEGSGPCGLAAAGHVGSVGLA